ncbi:hypothetical protein DRQ09_00800 [candidate division KSB1 bacterium]|nr:MAG: hypothetical protein DRQ09_00800 [candidate division KSB1 bacterium]
MNKKVLAVIKREYVTRVRTKGFIIGTLIFPTILTFLFVGIFLFAKFFRPSTKKYYVIDQTGQIYKDFVNMLSDTLENGEPKYLFFEKKVSAENLDTIIEEYQKLVLEKKIDGYLLIPEDLIDVREVRYAARSVSNFDEQRGFSNALSRIVTNLRLERKGLSPDEIRKEMALGRVRLVSKQVTKEGEIRKSGEGSFILTYILSYLLLILIMVFGQTITRSVIEEKSQRITEMIISSIKPVELMLGKIAGICLLGLTQLFVVGVIILLAVTYGEVLFVRFGVNRPEILNIVRNIEFSPVVFAFMLLFFFMGYIFYASLFAAIGAMVNTEDEGQQFLFPIIILVLIGYFIMFSVAQNPETSTAFWVSLIPCFTPVVMFARIAVTDPSLPKGAFLSIFTMGISTVLLIMLVAKIYRVGILMYGKKPSLKEVFKWIRY